MSRRVPSTGVSRVGSRAPSLAPPSRMSRPASTAGRRTTTAGPITAPSMRVPSDIPESNINVVVRCRGRTAQEIEDASPPITTTGGPVSGAITVATTPGAGVGPGASMAPTSAENTKTYKFDKVFGPEADQTTVFHGVAERMLDEVLAGYNCTIFAYGQTGTGKTYTMQGDMALTPLNEPSFEAGIIPRVLHRLFSLLEATEHSEYAVKCSYLEIYNEELRDLLSHDYGKPGAGANIKIFDDSSKKGVNVQGVEEAGIRDLMDGLNILKRGSQRRQVAETKLNTESSRSHSIFTLTVHVKETNADKGGEDMLRIGKFNLVDLAGSEAVVRSGAMGAQRREAGMINQSLLSLGRVINALVDKNSQHVPYRESRLTRLLQDSLGGRTKTCIVATVSPTKSNMEETLSTLEYASRAKSIRNKPEVNAHLTKAGLLREYLGDIERLKAELHAAREKNGVYIPDDQWKEMNEERTTRKTEYDEARSRVTAIEVELQTRRAEFESLTGRFVTTSSELAATREAERQLTHDLSAAKDEVERMREALDQEQAIAQAYAAGEERLHSVAGQLKTAAEEGERDVGGLFAKLGRVGTVLQDNNDSSHAFGQKMTTLSNDLGARMAKIHTVQGDFGTTLRSNLEAYAERGASDAKAHIGELDKSLGALDALATNLTATTRADKDAFSEAAATILGVRDELARTVSSWAEAMDARSSAMVTEVVAHQRTHLSTVSSVLEGTASLVDAVISSARGHVAAQAQHATQAQSQAKQAAEAEISRLKAQNTALADLLAQERAKSTQDAADLITNIGGMVRRFAESRDAALDQAVATITADNEAGEGAMQAFTSDHTATMDDMAAGAATFEAELQATKEQNDNHRQAGPAALDEVTDGLRTKLDEYGAATASEAGQRAEAAAALCAQIGTGVSSLTRAASTSADTAHATLSSGLDAARALHASASGYANASADDISRLTSTLLASHATSSASSGKAHASAKRKLEAMLSATSTFVSGLAVDEETGETPRKRPYEFPRAWERTGSREVLVDKIRRGSPLAVSSTLTAPTAAEESEGQQEAVVELSASAGSAEIDTTTPLMSPTKQRETREIRPPMSRTQSATDGGVHRVPSSSSLPEAKEARSASLDAGPPPSHLHISTRRRTTLKKLPSGEGERERGERERQPAVLGEGGNIGNLPRRKR